MQTYCDLCTRHSTKETNLHLRFYQRFGGVICQECIEDHPMLIEVNVANMDEFLKILEKVELGQSSNIPLILHLLRTGFLDSLVTTETKFINHGGGGMIEVRLIPTPLLQFLAA